MAVLSALRLTLCEYGRFVKPSFEAVLGRWAASELFAFGFPRDPAPAAMNAGQVWTGLPSGSLGCDFWSMVLRSTFYHELIN